MELRHLRYFSAVADELHFGRAAEKLNIAQPPLSQQIKKLETELGVRLFHRTKRRVSLTEAGEVFRTRARVILDAARNAAEEAGRIGRGEVGRLSVGFMSTATLNRLPLVLRAFKERYPDAEIELVQMTSGEQISAVAGGHLDIGFVSIRERPEPLTVDGVELAVETVWRETLIAALPPRHKLAGEREIPLAGLAGDTFIGLPQEPPSSYFDQVVDLCTKAGFSPRIKLKASQLPTALALIAAGYGVGLMPQSLAPAWRELVAFVPLAEKIEIGVTTVRRLDNRSPVLAAFCKALPPQ